MSNRFVSKKNKYTSGRIWISIVLLLVIIGLFNYGISTLSAQTLTEQKTGLTTAIQENIVQCYCIEGYYPESLSYLEDHYGIFYDKDQFFVDYQPMGQNIMPDVTIISKQK